MADFGLAKAVDDQQNLTHTGDILGTLRYMSPEAFEGKTGPAQRRLLPGADALRNAGLPAGVRRAHAQPVDRQVTNEEPQGLDRLKPRVPHNLVTIVQKAIKAQPGAALPRRPRTLLWIWSDSLMMNRSLHGDRPS